MLLFPQPALTEGHPLATPAGPSNTKGRSAGGPTVLSGGPAAQTLGQALAVTQQTVIVPERVALASAPGAGQVALASAPGAGQVAPASVMLDQLLTAPVERDATSNPVMRPPAGLRAVKPRRARKSVASSRASQLQTQLPVVQSHVVPAVVADQVPEVSGPEEVVTGGSLPVISLGAQPRLEVVPAPVVPSRRPASKVVIVRPKVMSSVTHMEACDGMLSGYVLQLEQSVGLSK